MLLKLQFLSDPRAIMTAFNQVIGTLLTKLSLIHEKFFRWKTQEKHMEKKQ